VCPGFRYFLLKAGNCKFFLKQRSESIYNSIPEDKIVILKNQINIIEENFLYQREINENLQIKLQEIKNNLVLFSVLSFFYNIFI
jgi:hypothetical protein